ncbi:MAG: streptogramin lyase [Flavobacteriales bacterium]|jgi:streptogramin lyase
MRFQLRFPAGLAFCCAVLLACGSDAPASADSCTPGASETCSCPDGTSSWQRCSDDGALGVCLCAGGEDAGGGTDGGVLPTDTGEDSDDPDASGDTSGEDTSGDTDCQTILQYIDEDGDGIGAEGAEPVEACEYLDGYSIVATDCDDDDDRSFPTAPELCDGIDNDCDGDIDEDTQDIEQYVDGDGDGYGDEDADSELTCNRLEGYVANNDDCDDSDETRNPGATDICDGADQDCDEDIDEDADYSLYWADVDGDSFGDEDAAPSSWCAPPEGLVTNRLDCDDDADTTNPDAEEVCDLTDNNCDGLIDEGTPLLVLWPDGDADSFGDGTAGATFSCEAQAGFVENRQDCDDGRDTVYPGAIEICDLQDNDCNGLVDINAVDPGTWYADADGDSFGDSRAITLACLAPARHVAVGGDCNDRDDETNTGAAEVCDGADNDCDGAIDNGVTNRCGECGEEPAEICGDFLDNDCDGDTDETDAGCFCDGRTAQPCYPGPAPTLGIGSCRGGTTDCDCPSGERFCANGEWGVCVGAVLPSAEVCDGIDNDCNGFIDEGLLNSCGECGPQPVEVCDGVDNDCDGVVDEGVRLSCGLCAGDESVEVCDTFDNDCDGFVDEGCDCPGEEEECYPGPVEAAGVGQCTWGVRSCYETGERVGICEGAVLPSLEICDGIDNDCDGRVDVDANGCSVCDSAAEICDGLDNDCDGFVDEALVNSCGQCVDTVAPEEDGGPDLCNGLDDDCDGFIDEGLINACGTCDEVCYVDGFDEDTFDEGEVDGVDTDDGIRLNSEVFTSSDLWIANTNDDTVTRINTDTGEEIATFSVGYIAGVGNDDPSRTAVDFNGDAWVANRAFSGQGSVAKIRGGDCTEDCVEFIVPVGGDDDVPRGLAIDAEGYVWVGLDRGQQLVKLDPSDGSVLGTFDVPHRTYGLAIDSSGIIWIATIGSAGIGAFDTATETHLGNWRATECTSPYGIAVDIDGNVWAGNWSCGTLLRLDRASFDAMDLTDDDATNDRPTMTVHGTNMSNTRGVAIDGYGSIWLASSGNDRLVQFDPQADGSVSQVGTYDTCDDPIGVGVANDERIWAVCRGADRAQRFENDGTLIGFVDVGNAPYSYSDMTGFQLRNFTAPRGTWRGTVDCTFQDCSFDEATWEAETPAGTTVSVRFRTRPSAGDPSEWTASYATSPADLRGQIPNGRYIDIEITLATSDEEVTPVVRNLDIGWQRP